MEPADYRLKPVKLWAKINLFLSFSSLCVRYFVAATQSWLTNTDPKELVSLGYIGVYYHHCHYYYCCWFVLGIGLRILLMLSYITSLWCLSDWEFYLVFLFVVALFFFKQYWSLNNSVSHLLSRYSTTWAMLPVPYLVF
jgi:hypothetical protein